MMRIGQGWDAHRLVAGRALLLGGVEIDSPLGLAGHSDADVLLHALCDALLGAAALGDLGRHFPSSDPEFKDCSSRVLLRRTMELVSEQGWRVVNTDATVLAERPPLAPYIEAMRTNIAADLQLALDCVSVKATTTDGLGSIGRGEGIGAQAVVLLESRGGE